MAEEKSIGITDLAYMGTILQTVMKNYSRILELSYHVNCIPIHCDGSDLNKIFGEENNISIWLPLDYKLRDKVARTMNE